MRKFAFFFFFLFFCFFAEAKNNSDTLFVGEQELAVEMGEFLHNLLDSTVALAISSEQGAILAKEGITQIRFVQYELTCKVSRNDLVITEKSFRSLPNGGRGQMVSTTTVEYHFAGTPKRGYFVCDLQSLAGQTKDKPWMAQNLLVAYRQQLLTTVREYRSAPKKFRNGTYLQPIR